MPKAPKYPRVIKHGSAVVKIYKLRHKTRGTIFQVVWRAIDGKRMKPQFADAADAVKEARLQASKLAKGHVEASELTASDRDELIAIRRLCNGTPALAAIEEWAKAREITNGQVLAAAESFAAASAEQGFKPIQIEKAYEAFLKSRRKETGKRVYHSKIKPAIEAFRGRSIHAIAAAEWENYFSTYADPVTRNDYRKKTMTMCRWAQDMGYIPRGIRLEIAFTKKLKEPAPQRGIIRPDTYAKLLRYLRHYHPHYLAAAVLAGFTGERADEIHGKRENRDNRQRWSDIHLDGNEPTMVVSFAKEGTPSNRTVPLPPAAVEWLKLPEIGEHKGNVCTAGAMERVREIGLTAGLNLPDNCFRHSCISYQIIDTGNTPQVAEWAGTSVDRISKNYRRTIFAENSETLALNVAGKPIPKALAKQWFAVTPEYAEGIEHLPAPQAAALKRD